MRRSEREVTPGEREFISHMARKAKDMLDCYDGNVEKGVATCLVHVRELLRAAAEAQGDKPEKAIAVVLREMRPWLADAKWIRECPKWIAKARALGIEV